MWHKDFWRQEMIRIDDKNTIDRLFKQYNVGGLFDMNIREKLFLTKYQKGDILFSEGDPQNYLMFMVGGRIKVSVNQENGKSRLICFIDDFEVIGDIVLIAGRDYATEVVAMTEVNCLAIDLSLYKTEILNDLQFLKWASKKFADVLLFNNEMTSFNLLYPLETRVATYINLNAENMKIKINMTILAEFLGTSYRQLQRVLAKFCKDGLLAKEKNTYEIINEIKLSELSNNSISKL